MTSNLLNPLGYGSDDSSDFGESEEEEPLKVPQTNVAKKMTISDKIPKLGQTLSYPVEPEAITEENSLMEGEDSDDWEMVGLNEPGTPDKKKTMALANNGNEVSYKFGIGEDEAIDD